MSKTLKRFFTNLSKDSTTCPKYYSIYSKIFQPSLYKKLKLVKTSNSEKYEIFKNHKLISEKKILKNEIIAKISKKNFLIIFDYFENSNSTSENLIFEFFENLRDKISENSKNDEKLRFFLRMILEFNFILFCENDPKIGDKIKIFDFLISENKKNYPMNFSNEIINLFYDNEKFAQISGLKKFSEKIFFLIKKKFPLYDEKKLEFSFFSIRQNLINFNNKIKFSDDEKILSPLNLILPQSFQNNVSLNNYYDFSKDQEFLYLKAEKDILKNEVLTLNYGNKTNLELLSENGICLKNNIFDNFVIKLNFENFPEILEMDEIKREILKTGPEKIDPEKFILERENLKNENLAVLRVF